MREITEPNYRKLNTANAVLIRLKYHLNKFEDSLLDKQTDEQTNNSVENSLPSNPSEPETTTYVPSAPGGPNVEGEIGVEVEGN